jgi:hypothetical protein
MKVARNAPCPCGSGKKSKQCCGAGEKVKQSTGSKLALVLLGLVLIAGFVLSILNFASDGSGAAAHTGSAQEAGANRVWSAEHGHYHDAP